VNARLAARVVGASVRGAAHVRSGLPNQDALAWRYTEGGGVVVAVADGHGSARSFRSDAGAGLAVAAATEILERRIPARPGGGDDKPAADQLRSAMREVLDRWAADVAGDLRRRPVTDEELARLGVARQEVEDDPSLAYGATLLTVVVTATAVLCTQLGDGDILAVWPNGEVRRPIPVDRRLLANETTSLCTPDAWTELRFGSHPLPAAPRLVLVATDGYANSFADERSFLKVGSDLLPMVDRQGIDEVGANLEAWLHETTERGAGDDVTVAVLSLAGSTATAPPPELPVTVAMPAPAPAKPARPAPSAARPAPPPPATPLVARMNGRDYQFDGGRSVQIGRDPAGDITTSNAFVSYRHAVLTPGAAGWILQDIGSRGGTYTGGVRVERLVVDRPMTVWLGRPGEGDSLELLPRVPAAARRPPPTAPVPVPVAAARPAAVSPAAVLGLILVTLLVFVVAWLLRREPPPEPRPPATTTRSIAGPVAWPACPAGRIEQLVPQGAGVVLAAGQPAGLPSQPSVHVALDRSAGPFTPFADRARAIEQARSQAGQAAQRASDPDLGRRRWVVLTQGGLYYVLAGLQGDGAPVPAGQRAPCDLAPNDAPQVAWVMIASPRTGEPAQPFVWQSEAEGQRP
jgi:Protein phosphatase 2C/FHA domain